MRFFLKIFRYFPFSWKSAIVGFLLKQKGIEIKEAKTPEELEQVFHLRWEVYGTEDYIDPKDYSNKKLTDKYDNYSISFLATRNEEPIGTMRLIHYSESGFPTEKAFNILNFPFSREQIVEISKLCIKKKFRGGIVSLGLFKKSLDYSKKQNIRYWFLATSPKLLKYFEVWCKLAPKLLPIGSLKPEHWNERITAKRYFQKAQIIPYILEIGKIK